MNQDRKLAMSATEAERASSLEREEERQLQEAIALSLMDVTTQSAPSFEDQLSDRRAGMKRKAEEGLEGTTTKRSTPAPLPAGLSISKFSAADDLAIALSLAAPSSATQATIKYPNGALRITRTPGRQNKKNCANLSDIIHKKALVSAYVFSFFIGDEELFDHLPLSHTSNEVPIYVGRDANQDPLVQLACQKVGIPFTGKLNKANLQSIRPTLEELYSKQLGKNYHAFYAWSPGSSHSKILVLVYPNFLRVVITSCNMMNTDTVWGDNHWYIHDLPRVPAISTSETTHFEKYFLSHLKMLGTPEAFLDSIRGVYDYSKIKVHLVISSPGTHSNDKAEDSGLLRLRRVLINLNSNLRPDPSKDLRLETCTASIGNLSASWLNSFYSCALGKKKISKTELQGPVPPVKIFYPSAGDVKKAHQSAQDAASNIGCHTRPWDDVPKAIKDRFYHYESKDIGRLFHQKLILAYDPSGIKVTPYYLYIGSANLSQSAWGNLTGNTKKNEATCDFKLEKITNFECGVVIPGDVIESLFEPGETWQEAIIPYDQNAPKYDLSKDKPWNDPRWVQNFQEGYQGS